MFRGKVQSKRHLMLAGSFGFAVAIVPHNDASAQAQTGASQELAQLGVTTTPHPTSTVEPRSGTNGKSIPPDVDRDAPEEIVVKAKRLLLKDKNSPSAVTELGSAQIAATGVSGSPGTLLRQAPSVYVYQQGIGDSAPELTIRGLRGLEIASTLDGIPTQDLEAPGSFYLSNNLGGVFTLSEIGGVSIYPGVAYPDKSTFGTIGGTVAYTTQRPTADRYFDVTGTVGSFGTYREGFAFNTGAVDSPLGSGDNAARFLLKYNNAQTQGFIDGTPNRENEMLAAFDKPYDDGLSKFQATVIYNTGVGLIENEPVPLPYLQKFGTFSNYPTNLDFAQQRNDFATLILKDDQYVSDIVQVGLTAFYIHNDNQLEDYAAPKVFLPNGPLNAGSSIPFVNNPAGFGEGGLYGPPTGGSLAGVAGGGGIFGGGYGGYFYGAGNRYNPGQYYNNPKACPPALIAASGGAGNSACGLNDQITGGSSDTYGLQPRLTLILPDYFGVANTIKIGGLFAKETTPTGYGYLGAFPQTPKDAQNLISSQSGGTQRTIYQGYIQDKIDLLDDTLHLTPGLTVEGTWSSFKNSAVFGSKISPYNSANGFNNGGVLLDQYGPFKSTKWDRQDLPFFNISYDLDKVLPALKGTSIYGSVGNSALFAPVTDFGPNTAGPPPYASVVHLYEGGVKYNTGNIAATVDYFYQKVDRDFGFFSFQSGPQNGLSVYSDFGQREFKGFEANVIYQVTPSVQLFANGSHLLAKNLVTSSASNTVAEDQYGTSFKGDPSTGVPDWLSTFGVDYNHKSTLRDGDALDARLTGTYTGHQFTSYDLGPTAYLNVPNYTGLAPLDFGGCPQPNLRPKGTTANGTTCDAYTRYNQVTGATTYDPNGGISPFVVFNLDLNYSIPTPSLPAIKRITFDLNIQNLFDERFFQYFYKQISPSNCAQTHPFTKSSPFFDPAPGATQNLTSNNYSCTPQFADGIPGQPFSVFFTVTARF